MRPNVGFVTTIVVLFICNTVCSSEEGTGCGCSGDLTRDSVEFVATSDLTRHSIGSINVASSIQSISKDMVYIQGGDDYLGTDKPILEADGEGPKRKVTLDSFYIDKFEVSNDAYRAFVDATGYVTESEVYGWSFVFDSAVPSGTKEKITQAVAGAEWWLPVNGSYWREPEGPGTDVFKTNRGNYPVVQVSWTDAKKFCEWRHGRLPTEAEWEYAAEGPENHLKSNAQIFPWGNKLLNKGGIHRTNVFQGKFPYENTIEDGYQHMAPVDALGPQNNYGLYNMIGNVWEWVEDWFTIHHNEEHQNNPKGPENGRDKVKKGGSFLCHHTFCYRYRIVARFPSTPDSATLNVGFRCVMDVSEHQQLFGDTDTKKLDDLKDSSDEEL